MLPLVFFGALITLVVGGVAKWYLDKTGSKYQIDRKEFLIASALMLCLVIPGTAYLGMQAAVSNQVTFTQNLNGWETRAHKVVIPCERDGVCQQCYDCDPYTVPVDYDCSYYVGEGENRRKVEKTCQRDETRYHKCPYTTEEWTFEIHTTVGDFTVARNVLPDNPERYRFRPYESRMRSLPYNAPTGTPSEWLVVRDRLQRGEPGPVTRRGDYENYILASSNTIMRQYSSAVDALVKAQMLPRLNSSIHSRYHSDRVYFVGVQPSANWQPAINRFNAALGNMRQGDLHLVIVDAAKVNNPDEYHLALMAYWLNPEVFDKEALAKNAIVLVLGAKDGKVEWARASTGMPLGNEELLLQLRNDLRGVAIDPATLLGNPTARVTGDRQVQVSLTNSVLENILWGQNGFRRIRMKDHGDGNPNFEYLLNEIAPTTGQMVFILVVITLFACVAWGFCIVHGTPGVGRRFRP